MTQNRDELKKKCRLAISEQKCGDTFCADPAKVHICWCDIYAEACLSAIEQSGCTICPNDGVSCNRSETAEESVSAVPASSNEDGEARRIEREIGAKIKSLWDEALAEYREHQASTPRRMNKDDAVRQAYLHGKVSGTGSAYREHERRQPMFLVGSTRLHNDCDVGACVACHEDEKNA